MIRTLSNVSEAVQWLRARVTGTLHTDSRRIAPGDGFIAWPGAATDGRAHVRDALVRGGRYDEVGAVFGRKRPAVGFSLDLKELVQAVTPRSLRQAILAPWGEQAGLRHAVQYLRAKGETVVCVLPGHEHQTNEFQCDRQLLEVDGQWMVEAISKN